jgi:two-component system, OmpR family, response regulator
MTKKRVLIVDDEEGFTRLLRLNLGCTGRYTVRTENSAPEALTAVREFRPDLILLDVMMPGLDGGAVAAQLQSRSDTRGIPIVFVTAAVRKDEVATQHGVIGGAPFIAKPVDLDELLRCIRRVLDGPIPVGSPSRTLTGAGVAGSR